MRRVLAVGLTLIGVLAFTGAPARAQVADGPTISVGRSELVLGQKLLVTGENWPARPVAVQLCGNNGVNGTSDCDLPGSRTFGVSKSGRFSGAIVVGRPPATCPCVVIARSTTSDAEDSIPVTIDGVDTTPGPPPEKHQAAPTNVSIFVSFAEGPSWREWTGVQPSRDVAITVTNSGTRATGDGSVDVTYGRSNFPAGFAGTATFKSLEPGDKTVVHVRFPLDPLSFGDYNLRIRLDAPYAHAEKIAGFTVQPWGLLVMALGLIAFADLLLIRRVRRRRRALEPGDDSVAKREPRTLELEPPRPAETPFVVASARVVDTVVTEVPIVPARAMAAEPCERVPVLFTLPDHTNAITVSVSGSFNDWSTSANLMHFDGERWTTTVALPAGVTVEYRFLVDACEWVDDPAAVERRANGLGNENCVLQVRAANGNGSHPVPELDSTVLQHSVTAD